MSPRESRNSLPSEHRVHWYVIERVLGQGGFGITYLAADTNLDQPVAIKEYLPSELAVRASDSTVHPASDDHAKRYDWGLERFIQEARTLAKFKHAAVVRMLSVFEENNTAYMVMEYEQGDSFQDILTEQRTLAEQQLTNMVLPILDGLEVIHEQGFIHRDIKPANIFIRKDGNPVLLDFGSARQALGQATRTLTSIVSPGYAPFEQYYSKSDKQGPWTDIYGLAATLYRGAIGTAPLDAIRRSDAILREKHDTLVAAMEAGADNYSGRFLQAIDHGLRFSEKQRPQTVSEWRSQFQATHDEDLLAAPPQQTDKQPPRTFAAQAGDDAGDDADYDADAIDSELLFAPVALPQAVQAAGNSPALKSGVAERYADPGEVIRSRRRWPMVLLVCALLAVGASYFAVQRGLLASIGSSPDASRPPDRTDVPAEVTEPGASPIRSLGGDPDKPIDAARRARTIAALLDRAKLAVNRDHVIEPAGESAMSFYEQVLALDPDNATARAAMRDIVDTLALRAGRAAARNDFVTAEALLAKAAQLEPGSRPVAFAQEQLAQQKLQWQDKQAVQTRIAELLEAAEAGLNAGRLSAPPGDNAYEHFRNVLNIDANNAAAAQGLSRIVERYVAQANAAINKQDFNIARQALDHAAVILPEAGNAKLATERLIAEEGSHVARQTKVRKIESLLNAAEDDIRTLRLSKPADDSAVYRYRQVLKLDPNNREARRGLEIVVEKYLDLAGKARDANEADALGEYLQAAKAVLPNAPNIKLFERTLVDYQRQQAAREERNRDAATRRLLEGAERNAAAEAQRRQAALLQRRPEIMLSFEGLTHEYARFGLRQTDLRHNIENRLRQAGFALVPKHDVGKASKARRLHVRFRADLNTSSGMYAYTANVTVSEQPADARLGTALVDTWSQSESGAAHSAGLGELTTVFMGLVERYIRDRGN